MPSLGVNEVLDVSDGICAHLTGGLGNQLFVLAAAWQQSQRLSCPLFIDISRFVAGDLRNFDLGGLALPGIVIGSDSPWMKKTTRKLSKWTGNRIPALKVYRETSFSFQDGINQVVPGTTLMGYFQSPKYFNEIEDDLVSMLLAAPETAEEKKILGQFGANQKTLHIRRGDYLTPTTNAVHGMATGQYFNRALDLMDRLLPELDSMAFSDSPDLAREDLKGRGGVKFFDQTESLSGLNTLKAMASGTGFVMSNSSFSWWGAWLMSKGNGGPVIAPRPWLSAGESASDLLLADWLTLDAR